MLLKSFNANLSWSYGETAGVIHSLFQKELIDQEVNSLVFFIFRTKFGGTQCLREMESKAN